MNIGVFCSAHELRAQYTAPVRDFARHVGEHGHTLIWGGSATGLMRVVADGVQQAGGKLIGVTFKQYQADVYKHADEIVIAEDLFDRKRIMIERSDAFVILVGGVGTLDEATDLIELQREGVHRVPVVFLNTNDFYASLREQFALMQKEGFLDAPMEELVHFADGSHEALDIIVGELHLNDSE